MVEYNFDQGERQFRWSSENWPRVIEMAKRFGFVCEFDLLKQRGDLPALTVKELKVALCKAIDDGALPNMKLTGVLEDYFGLRNIGKSNGFAFFVEDHAITIHEDDPRWQGIFFHYLIDFVRALEDEPITLSWST